MLLLCPTKTKTYCWISFETLWQMTSVLQVSWYLKGTQCLDLLIPLFGTLSAFTHLCQITSTVPLCCSIRQLQLSEYTCRWENWHTHWLWASSLLQNNIMFLLWIIVRFRGKVTIKQGVLQGVATLGSSNHHHHVFLPSHLDQNILPSSTFSYRCGHIWLPKNYLNPFKQPTIFRLGIINIQDKRGCTLWR